MKRKGREEDDEDMKIRGREETTASGFKFNCGKRTRNDLLNRTSATSDLNYCDKCLTSSGDGALVLDTVRRRDRESDC